MLLSVRCILPYFSIVCKVVEPHSGTFSKVIIPYAGIATKLVEPHSGTVNKVVEP